MRKFNISVNGKSYEVEVEEIGGAATSAPVYSAPASAPAPAAPAAAPAAPAPKPAAPAAGGSEGSTKVTSPMPGTILSINVNVGDAVSEGQAIVILEAMKMENEIVAPQDGTITSVVAKGASVNSGDLLAAME